MRYSILGPAKQTFGPSLRISVILMLLAFLFCGLAYAVARDVQDRTAWIVFEALTLFFCVYVACHLTSRAWLHETGISYRRIFGYGEVRWEEIEWIYYGAVELDVHGVLVLGKLEKLKLITREHHKISFVGIRNAGVLYETASQKTFERLYRRAVEEFNCGSELGFGSICVEPSRGITIRKWLSSRRILWQEIAGFQVNEYLASFERAARYFAIRVPTERIANVRVLHALLMGVMKKRGQTGVGDRPGLKSIRAASGKKMLVRLAELFGRDNPLRP